MSDRESYRTPNGTRALFCTTMLGKRQHLTLQGLFPASTACGHPVNGWSSGPIRTLIGMTCWTCRRNVRRGRHGMSPLAYPWFLVAKALPLWEKTFGRKKAARRDAEREPISTDEIFGKE